MPPKTKFHEGEKVLCFQGQLLYEAKCVKVDVKDKQTRYYIHYNGWNKGWDEWVPESRVLKHNEAGLQKQKELLNAYGAGAVMKASKGGCKSGKKEAEKKEEKEKTEKEENENEKEKNGSGRKSVKKEAEKKEEKEKTEEEEKEKEKEENGSRPKSVKKEAEKKEEKEKTEKENGKEKKGSGRNPGKKEAEKKEKEKTAKEEKEKKGSGSSQAVSKKKQEKATPAASLRSRLSASPATSGRTSAAASSSRRLKRRWTRANAPKVETEEVFVSHIDVKIKMPEELKPWLVDDCDLITRQKMLVNLPCRNTVDNILDDYVKIKTAENDVNKDAVIEAMAGVKDYFNVMLGTQLLYKFERPQYSEIMAENPGKSMSSLYGATHLLRLFVRLGQMLGYTPMDENCVEILLTHVHDFLKFVEEALRLNMMKENTDSKELNTQYMLKNSASLFSHTDYSITTPEYHRKAI